MKAERAFTPKALHMVQPKVSLRSKRHLGGGQKNRTPKVFHKRVMGRVTLWTDGLSLWNTFGVHEIIMLSQGGARFAG